MDSSAPKADRLDPPEKLLDGARRIDVDVTGRSEDRIRRAARHAWIAENREAIASWNDWVGRNGPPLEHYRAF